MRQVSSRGIQAGRDVVDVGAETADWDGGVWPSNAIECRHVSFLSFRLLIISLSLQSQQHVSLGERPDWRGYLKLYLDHLIYALTLHLFFLGQDRRTSHRPKEALAIPRLRRVIERMRTDLRTNLDLKTLAAESGYSRNHFLRMFRTATDFTPHQYLLRLRVEKAQSLMKDQSLRMIDIAESCGFASQSQFSRVFKQVVGVSPKHYRP
jgi:AraC-like DNA-binding protein